MSDRGMKKWAPFSSLIEQSTCLEEMRYQKNKIEKPLISIEKAREINEILTNYHGQELLITYQSSVFQIWIKRVSTHIKEHLL